MREKLKKQFGIGNFNVAVEEDDEAEMEQEEEEDKNFEQVLNDEYADD